MELINATKMQAGYTLGMGETLNETCPLPRHCRERRRSNERMHYD